MKNKKFSLEKIAQFNNYIITKSIYMNFTITTEWVQY